MSNIFDRKVSSNAELTHPEVTSEMDDSAFLAADEAVNSSEHQTPTDVKLVTQELLKHGYLEEARKSELFRSAVGYEQEILAALEPLDLAMRLDAHRGVAFLVVAQTAYAQSDDEGAWLHPLVRRQRLTLEQSLLIALLRQAFALHEQESGVGEGDAKVAVDDLLPQCLPYFGDSGSDAKNESRLLTLLDQLKTYGIVSEVDRKQEVTIRPLIAYLANPESLTALLQVLKESSESSDAAEEES
jgi:hypothetical protein